MKKKLSRLRLPKSRGRRLRPKARVLRKKSLLKRNLKESKMSAKLKRNATQS